MNEIMADQCTTRGRTYMGWNSRRNYVYTIKLGDINILLNREEYISRPPPSKNISIFSDIIVRQI